MKLFFVFSIDYQLISHRKDLVKAAVEAGYDVTVVAKDTGYKREILELGVQFIELPINRVGKNIIEEIKTFYYLYRLYRKKRPDIVHHVSIKVVLWGGLAARLSGVKAVVNAINGLGVFFQNGKVDSIVKKIFLWIIRFAHKRKNIVTIFQNTDDRFFFLSHYALNEEQTTMISGSGIDLNIFRYVPEKESDKLKIVFSSRMVEDKGVKDIVEAAKILKDEFGDKISFLLYGLLETNPQAISKLYLDTECDGCYICYCGFTRDIKLVLEDAAIVILPSYYREGIPKSLIEATAIGRPIITTNWVGCKETVVNGKNGYLVPIKSPGLIADRLRLLIQNDTLREKMGQYSRKIAEDKFSLERVINDHLHIYQSLINKEI